MLQWILGPAGSGKTHALFTRLEQLPENTHAILLVPEQATFEYEREMLTLPPEKRAEVLSFSRLCHRVGKEVGGIAGIPLTDDEKLLLMARAVGEVAPMLTLYRKQAGQVPFYRHLLSLIAECNHKEITPQSLVSASALLGESSLAKKLQEIGLIFSAYSALISRSYIDADTQLQQLQEQLQEFPFFQNRVVFMDAFKDFTVPQYNIIHQIIGQCDQLTIAMCADRLQPTHNLELFANTKGAIMAITQMANKQSVPVASPILLTHRPRFAHPALTAMAQVLEGDDITYPQETDAITVCSCKGIYDEVSTVATMIKKLVREETCRYSDITVVMANPAEYRTAIDSIFPRHAIPYFSDAPRPFTDGPLAALVLKTMETAATGYDTAKLLALTKTYLLGFSPDEIAMLENYAFLWSVKGKDWQKEFVNSLTGKGQPTPEETETINRLRLRLITPLAQFTNQCKAATTGRQYIEALYGLLTHFKVFDHIQSLAEQVTQNGDPFEGEDLLRSWELLMNVLDQTVRGAGDASYSTAQFNHLFSVILSGCEMNKIPQGLNQVTIGDAARVRPAHCKVMFLMGANNGVFPRLPSSGGLLTDHERMLMNQVELPISDRCEFDTVEANFVFYQLACTATHKVVFTYQTASSEQTLSPSYPLTKIMEAIPYCEQYQPLSPLEKVTTLATGMEILAEQYHTDTTDAHSLYAYYAQKHPRLLEQLQRIENPAPTTLSHANAKALFGQQITVSPSGIEVFHKCRFYYYCRYGLRVTAQKPIGIDTLSRGSMVHYVLEHMLKNHGSKGLSSLSPDQMKSNIHAMLSQYIEENLGGIEDKPASFRFTLEQIEALLLTLLTHMAQEMADSLFETAGCEVSMKWGEDVEPYTIPLPDGGSVSVIGSVDRIDTYQKDGITYFRVVDYKTGTKDFNLNDIYYGIGLQMLIYLYGMEQQGSFLGDHRYPAGILYMPAEPGEAKLGETSQKDFMKALRMKGLIANHPDILHGMDPNNTGLYVPLKYTKKGIEGSLAELEFFGKTRKVIEALLQQMGTALLTGDIVCNPLDPAGGYDACSFCEYHRVCPKDRLAPHDAVPDLTKEQKEFLLKGGDPHALYTHTQSETGH